MGAALTFSAGGARRGGTVLAKKVDNFSGSEVSALRIKRSVDGGTTHSSSEPLLVQVHPNIQPDSVEYDAQARQIRNCRML